MFNEFDEILRGYTNEEYAYALHTTIINYLDSIGVLSEHKYCEYLNANFENTLKKVHQASIAEAERIIEKWKKGDKNGFMD